MTTTINLPAVIEKRIKPKPTKREMIKALAARHHAKAMDEFEQARVRYESLKKKLAEDVHAWVKEQFDNGAVAMDQDPSVNEYNAHLMAMNGTARVHVSFTLLNPPKRFLKAWEEIQKLGMSRFNTPQLADSRRFVLAQVDGLTAGSRVDAMLKDEGMVKALDSMLKKIEKYSESPATESAVTV